MTERFFRRLAEAAREVTVKPCPFCGAQPRVDADQSRGRILCETVNCPASTTSTGDLSTDFHKMLAAWNRRADT